MSGADAPTLAVRHRGLLMVAVMGASIIQFLDSTIANVAIPHMQTALGATPETVTWVLTSFIIARFDELPQPRQVPEQHRCLAAPNPRASRARSAGFRA